MKKTIIIASAVIVLLAAEWFIAPIVHKHKEIIMSPPTIITKTVTNTVSVPTPPPTYHVGDTQEGVTLVGIYHTSYQNMRGAVGPTVPAIAFAVSGVSEDELAQSSIIRTTKGFITPSSVTRVPECGDNACVVFEDLPAVTFYYKDMKWVL